MTTREPVHGSPIPRAAACIAAPAGGRRRPCWRARVAAPRRGGAALDFDRHPDQCDGDCSGGQAAKVVPPLEAQRHLVQRVSANQLSQPTQPTQPTVTRRTARWCLHVARAAVASRVSLRHDAARMAAGTIMHHLAWSWGTGERGSASSGGLFEDECRRAPAAGCMGMRHADTRMETVDELQRCGAASKDMQGGQRGGDAGALQPPADFGARQRSQQVLSQQPNQRTSKSSTHAYLACLAVRDIVHEFFFKMSHRPSSRWSPARKYPCACQPGTWCTAMPDGIPHQRNQSLETHWARQIMTVGQR